MAKEVKTITIKNWWIVLVVGLIISFIPGIWRFGKYFMLLGLYDGIASPKGNRLVTAIISIFLLLLYELFTGVLAGDSFSVTLGGI